MIGRDASVSGRAALARTAPGRRILAQAALGSAGFRAFRRYRGEYEAGFPGFRARFAADLRGAMGADRSPASTQRAFADEVGSPELALGPDGAERAAARLAGAGALEDRVGRILDSNFVKMTMPVLSALYDAAAAFDGRDDPEMRRSMVDGHVIAIDLSEPMDRIVDRDEDLGYLDDYRLMCPYILQVARAKIARGGDEVLGAFEAGLREAMAGQRLDVEMKSRPGRITGGEMDESYKKYRAVMGTAGRNMALARRPLGEAFCAGMGSAAEGVGCGNEMEDSFRAGRVKVPSWPLYYSVLAGGARRGFELTMERAGMYLREARLALGMLPAGFAHRGFLEFAFLTVEHYNAFWYGRLRREAPWRRFESGLPGGAP